SLREPVATAVNLINESGAHVVSLDVPTGLDPDATSVPDGTNTEYVEADENITFHDEKPIHASLDNVTVVDIGIPDAAEEFVGAGDLKLLERDPESHKGDNGDILVVGGGPYVGAPTLSSLAALRAGCDLVKVATPADVAETVQSYSPNLIVRELDGERLTTDDVDRVLELAAGVDAVVIGPGLGEEDESVEAVREILADAEVDKAVVDAEAIQAIDAVQDDTDIIATPHAGELGRFVDVPAGWEERRDVVEEFSLEHGVTTLLKGKYDVISDGDTTRVSRTGNAGMTVGGTGDVLAGVCGFLITQLDTVNAACIGAFVNGRAGDIVYENEGNGLVATDIIDELPDAMRPTE
ncbi:MAG: NAD(P)H-hydrate dehydratase, partial [Halobacteria archaeon]|nr:NAD(P)H-hydrate dehydratase [Halobacteria archaeon]